MREQKKHWVLKIVLALVALFLIAVGVVDCAPKQKTVEKTVAYENK